MKLRDFYDLLGKELVALRARYPAENPSGEQDLMRWKVALHPADWDELLIAFTPDYEQEADKLLSKLRLPRPVFEDGDNVGNIHGCATYISSDIDRGVVHIFAGFDDSIPTSLLDFGSIG